MKEIVQKNDKILRKKAREIPIKEIKTLKIKKVLKEMSQALKEQDDGVAIAAPQIGHSLAIFVVSGKIFHKDFAKGISEMKKVHDDDVPKDVVFINPKISRLSRDKEWMPEGCLSVRWLYGKALRSKKAMVAAYDENGKKFIRGASGLLAQIFQHETDHLNGILFIDHAKDIREEPPATDQQ